MADITSSGTTATTASNEFAGLDPPPTSSTTLIVSTSTAPSTRPPATVGPPPGLPEAPTTSNPTPPAPTVAGPRATAAPPTPAPPRPAPTTRQVPTTAFQPLPAAITLSYLQGADGSLIVPVNGSATITIFNSGGRDGQWQLASAEQSVASLSSTAGTLAPGATTTITVRNTSGRPGGSLLVGTASPSSRVSIRVSVK